jgi:hypothetical protein
MAAANNNPRPPPAVAEQQAFGEREARQAGPSGSQCRTHGKFAVAGCHSGKNQIRHVDAGDQQQSGDGA